MNLKNILRSGDYVVPIPFGAHITLQYNENGIIEKAFKGWNTVEDITTEISALKQSITTFPKTIAVRSKLGTSWIYGVLYTASNIMSEFDNVEDALLDMYGAHPNFFSFFACDVKSTAYSFNGYSSMQTWFTANQFNSLNGFLAGSNYDEAVLKHFLNSRFPFKCPEFASYIIMNGTDTTYVETEVIAHVVKSVKKELAENGQIIGRITCSDNKELRYDYSEIVKFNIDRNVCILTDSTGTIGYSYPIDSKAHEISDTLVCEYCGKPIKVETDSITICSNTHCLSRMYIDIRHICNVFELPLISYEKYMQYVKAEFIKHIEDMFELPEYKDQEIHTTLSKMLNAVVPISQVRNRSIFNLVANNCSNNIQTFSYYMSHPDNICKDFNIDIVTPGIRDLITWLKDPENVQTVDSILSNDNFIFDVKDKKFDGDPILRGKVVFVTGKFNHGSTSDIIEILQSYSAVVKTSFDDSINTVLIGDIPEDVSGVNVRKAKKTHVPIFQEQGFFDFYDIDNDLKINLS